MRIVAVICLLFLVLSAADGPLSNFTAPRLRRSISGVPLGGMTNTTRWSFVSIVMVPDISCDSVAGLAGLFDLVLHRVNPGASHVSSKAKRFGLDACVDGICFCDEITDSPHAVRVLELVTACSMPSLVLPDAGEFPFEFETRSDLPPARKKKGWIPWI